MEKEDQDVSSVLRFPADRCPPLTLHVVGLVVEAFGYQRIIYGSSTSASSTNSNDWYEIARESLTELGVDQEGIDGVFGANASHVYGGA